MPLLPRKPEKPAPKVSDMLAYPQHDQPCQRIAYDNPKQMFDAMLLDALSG